MKPAITLLLLVAALLAACTGEQIAEPVVPQEIATTLPPSAVPPRETVVPSPTPAATDVPLLEATREPSIPTAASTPEPAAILEATKQPPAAQVISGQTDEGAYFYGNPDAALTLIDYSDFL